MHCVFISNCELHALPKTRSLLDRYAQRIGDRAWATRMTQAGLEELHTALRRQATRQSSVACYRSDTALGLRLVWIVGNHTRYDDRAWYAVATRSKETTGPLDLPYRHAALMAKFAGLAHDLGKASVRFQQKLQDSLHAGLAGKASGDLIRHEWISAWLLQHMHSQRVPLSLDALTKSWADMSATRGKPGSVNASNNPPVASVLTCAQDAVLWSVCTHHGAIGGQLQGSNGLTIDGSLHIKEYDGLSIDDNVSLATGLQVNHQDAKRWEGVFSDMEKTRQRLRQIDRPSEYWEALLLVSRAALILADHKVSSQEFPCSEKTAMEEGVLFANTKAIPPQNAPKTSLRGSSRRKSKTENPVRYLDQPLSWHLQEVGKLAAQNMQMFTGRDLPQLSPALRDFVLDKRSPEGSRFAWQDEAVDAIKPLAGGKLIFSIASTGAGKTLANLKMACAMRNDGARLDIAFNLRSLTQQTFDAYKEHFSSEHQLQFEKDFACLMGERGFIDRDFSKEDEDEIDKEEIDEVIGGEASLPEWFSSLANHDHDHKLAKLLVSPVLISTMDWIVAAGEPGQQDRHAKALIRVANSDLILDEVDSYDVKATVAVMRVVQIAATFGRNVIVSSATLNPVLAQGIAEAYAAGWRRYQALSVGDPGWSAVVVGNQFAPKQKCNPTAEELTSLYADSLQLICDYLKGQDATKRYRVCPVTERDRFPAEIAEAAARMHDDNAARVDGLDCRLSIGLIRVANIKTCVAVSDHLREDGRFSVAAYHARDLVDRRAWKESWLDRILRRGGDTGAWLEELLRLEPWIGEAKGDVRLVLVATPVEEVGRDHDFDWAIIEPSSMHSIIQTAGRVNRHRQTPIPEDRHNIVVLSRNYLALEHPEKTCCFIKPGLEESKDGSTGESSHHEHDVQKILLPLNPAFTPTNRMDSALIFDSHGAKTLFSSYDETATGWKLRHAEKIIRGDSRFSLGIMLKEFRREYPLRDSDGQKHTGYSVDIDAGKFTIAGDAKNIKIGDVSINDEREERTWLWFPPDKIRNQKSFVSMPNVGASSKMIVTWNTVKWKT